MAKSRVMLVLILLLQGVDGAKARVMLVLILLLQGVAGAKARVMFSIDIGCLYSLFSLYLNKYVLKSKKNY